MGSSPSSDSPPKTTGEDRLPIIIHEPKVREALGDCSRWKVWDLLRNDPEFPPPRIIAGKRSWFLAEIKDYIETRPRSSPACTSSGARCRLNSGRMLAP